MDDIRDYGLLQKALEDYTLLINPPLIHELNTLKLECLPSSYAKLIHITSILEENINAFTAILNAIHYTSDTLCYIIDASSKTPQIYIGTSGGSPLSFALLEQGIRQCFKQATFEVIKVPRLFLDTLFHPKNYKMLTLLESMPVPIIPTPPLLSQFTTLMTSTSYVAVFLLTPLLNAKVYERFECLAELYSTLSSFNHANFSLARGTNKNHSSTQTNASSTIHTHTQVSGTTENSSLSHTGFYTSTISTILPYTNSKTATLSLACNKAHTEANSSTESLSETITDTTNDTLTQNDSTGSAKNSNHTISYSAENRLITYSLSNLERILNALQSLINIPTFNYSSYFLSSNAATSLNAAYFFQSLITNETAIQPPTLNTWLNTSSTYPLILNYLKQLTAPYFITPTHSIMSEMWLDASAAVHSFYMPIS